jgi:hypothetical protein
MKPPFRFKDRAEELESDAVLIRRVATGILDGEALGREPGRTLEIYTVLGEVKATS